MLSMQIYFFCRVDSNEDSRECSFGSVAFMPDDSSVLAGTNQGTVVMFNTVTSLEEATYNCHESTIYNIEVRFRFVLKT